MYATDAEYRELVGVATSVARAEYARGLRRGFALPLIVIGLGLLARACLADPTPVATCVPARVVAHAAP